MTWRKNPAGNWRKSSASNSGACAEVGQDGTVVGVRDSKDGEAGPVLTFSAAAWAAFTARVKRGA